MTKLATQWKTKSGFDTATDNAGFSLLLETGDNLLLETGDELLLEDTVITPKNPSEWADVTKNRTAWSESSISTQDDMLTESGDTRITEAGDQRVTEDASPARKSPTEWSEA